MHAQLVSEMMGSNEYSQRWAKIFKDNDGYFVELYDGDEAIRQVDVTEHSIHYANDVADNWTSGIIKE